MVKWLCEGAPFETITSILRFVVPLDSRYDVEMNLRFESSVVS